MQLGGLDTPREQFKGLLEIKKLQRASDAVSFEVYPALNPEFDLHHHLLAGWGVPIGEPCS
jgi:hypothetical protein